MIYWGRSRPRSGEHLLTLPIRSSLPLFLEAVHQKESRRTKWNNPLADHIKSRFLGPAGSRPEERLEICPAEFGGRKAARVHPCATAAENLPHMP
eukprot:3368353-Pyramimonas_sp.AAC.1